MAKFFPGCCVVVSGDLPGDEVVAGVAEGGYLVGREALRAAGDRHRRRAEHFHLAQRKHRLHARHHDRDVPAAKTDISNAVINFLTAHWFPTHKKIVIN